MYKNVFLSKIQIIFFCLKNYLLANVNDFFRISFSLSFKHTNNFSEKKIKFKQRNIFSATFNFKYVMLY